MSEVVERRMEAMEEEFSEMEKLKILDLEKIRKITKSRKDFEYKMIGLFKNLNDCKNYIQHEHDLLEYIKLRKRNLRMPDRTTKAEHRIIKRIKNLYETGVQRHRTDYNFCKDYYKFLKKYNYNSALSAIHVLINNHPKNPDSWITAAKYYLNDKKVPKTALSMLHKGISLNKDSAELYSEVIMLEIQQVVDTDDSVKSEDDAEVQRKQETCVTALNGYMRIAFKNITDCMFYCKLLKYLSSYKFTAGLQNDIITKLLETHHTNPELWDYLAKREYDGFHYGDAETASQKFKSTFCFEKYVEGLSRVPESSKQDLWNMCIEFLIKVNLEDYASRNVSKSKLLLEAYEKAANEGYLSEEHFITWIDKVKETPEKYAIAEKGTSAYPKSVHLWRQRFYLKQDLVIDKPDADKELNETFKLGIEKLGDESLTLWSGMIRYYQLNSDTEMVDQLYQEGIKQTGLVGRELKTRYITYLNLNKGIGAARKAYHLIARVRPFCKELHEAMWRAETTEIKFDYESWGEVHALAVEQFGSEDVDVWIDYLRFYMLYHKSFDLKVVSDISQKALRTLPEHRKLEFRDKYMQLQNLCRQDTD